MIEELGELEATMLVWSALGGGSISLPYLEREAFGEIDERFRFYGFVNDSEFIAACRQRGIKVFGIVFEVQGWEFPVELNHAEDEILSMNELRGAGRRAWMGLREFSQDRYPKLWAPFGKYFPNGLVNSEGEKVSDLLEECCSRDIDGAPCHARWVESPDREHYCYTMDRTNPVWREYLKAIIRIQIDAGVDGIQLDEAELPLTSLQYGGCFCKDCMKGFSKYLREMDAEARPPDVAAENLSTFHYGRWLKEKGYDFRTRQQDTPLFWDYLRWQRQAITKYFRELADYSRAYAAEQGRSIEVSGNFFNLFDQYYAMEQDVDVIITEMRNTSFRQPEWYRYVAGFSGDKPVVVVENPYGGVVPELVDKLGRGKGYDLFRMSVYEAAALGASMSIPYGSWMGSVVQDSFYAPHDLSVEIQRFLADNERLFGPRSLAEVGVVYSVESNFQAMARREVFVDNRTNVTGHEEVLFWTVCQALTSALQLYDVIMFPDGDTRRDVLEPEDLASYRTLILPMVTSLTRPQTELLTAYLNGGGRIIALGPVGTNTPDDSPGWRSHQGLKAYRPRDRSWMEEVEADAQLRVRTDVDMAANLQRLTRGAALHIIRYGYDEKEDRVPTIPKVELELRLEGGIEAPTAHSPAGRLRLEQDELRDGYAFTLYDVPLYSIIELPLRSSGTRS